MNSDAEILHKLTAIFEELFEVPAEKVKLDARLYEDLDLDSIDAIDLMVRLQNLIGKRVNPEDFKNVRTVSDIINCIKKLVADNGSAQN